MILESDDTASTEDHVSPPSSVSSPATPHQRSPVMSSLRSFPPPLHLQDSTMWYRGAVKLLSYCDRRQDRSLSALTRLHWMLEYAEPRHFSGFQINRLAVRCLAMEWPQCYNLVRSMTGQRVVPYVRWMANSRSNYQKAGDLFLEQLAVQPSERLSTFLKKQYMIDYKKPRRVRRSPLSAYWAGSSALLMAVREGNVELVRALLDADADPNITDADAFSCYFGQHQTGTVHFDCGCVG